MTLLDYYEGIAEAKRATASEPDADFRGMTPERLRFRYGSYEVVSRKKKGAGKGYKETYGWVWRDWRGYMSALRELFPSHYAIQLCREEYSDLTGDLWWDVPGYRGEHLRAYRSRITAIRKEYGLRSADVAEFMRVG